MSKRTTMIARLLMVIYIIILAYLCFGNISEIPHVKRAYWGVATDKLVHFLMFLPFAPLSYFCAGRKPSSIWKSMLAVICIFTVGCIIAFGTELGQSFVPNRVADPMDFKADAMALAISSMLTFFVILIHNSRASR